MIATLMIALALLCMPESATAKDIYRWTDESGATHYADKVPRKYTGVARKVATEQGSTARTGAGADNVRSAPIISSAPAQSGNAAEPNSGNVVSFGASGSSGTEDGAADCEALRRQYWDSQACFNQYRNANGSVKAEAFTQCEEVRNPVEQCGPLIIQP